MKINVTNKVELRQRSEKFNDIFSDSTNTNPTSNPYSIGFDEQQTSVLTESEDLVNQRVEEIKKISQTVKELAEITRQLNEMVMEQGTIIDRIDYNLETTENHVEKAVEEIKTAEKYQKAMRVKIIVLILLLLILGAIIILILKIAL